ncbi:hypothetical protein [Bifidobacterium oedipodis]|uniref:C2H2-type domain-containing protein n=1 Tax=Bifidobacterium oedipodis TaxID=2675322 RepID=A0A7Y0ENG0_9BIFI|nr:hypothetical protein [Bifidobacterium sp. DSM 109957]NMM93460.1 hypothetical protein [Bifidobacterium sp. DSM 109957]
MTGHEDHIVVTEYDRHGLRWWCSCGYDTDNLKELRNHLNRKEDHDRPMREQ